ARPPLPSGWDLTLQRGTITATVVDGGREGGRALRLAAESGEGAGSVSTRVPVYPNHRYELSGWIRPESILSADNASGATLSVTLGQPRGTRFATNRLRGNRNWVIQRVTFEPGSSQEATIALALGGTGVAAGVALFDDLVLRNLGPVD